MSDSIQLIDGGLDPQQKSIESLHLFKPGDLIVFSGLKIDATLVRLFTGSSYSHTTIILDTNLEGHPEQKVAIAESTSYTSLPNFRNKKCKAGVQIHYLETWLNAYRSYGKAWWVPLAKPLNSQAIKNMQNWLWELHENQVHYSCWKSIGAWLKINRHLIDADSQNLQQMFCSELVTQALQVAGVVDKSIIACEQTPQEAVNLSCFDTPVLLEI